MDIIRITTPAVLDVLQMFFEDLELYDWTMLGDVRDHTRQSDLQLLTAVIALECMFQIDIPDDLIQDVGLSVVEFTQALNKLPKVQDVLWVAKRIRLYAVTVRRCAIGGEK